MTTTPIGLPTLKTTVPPMDQTNVWGDVEDSSSQTSHPSYALKICGTDITMMLTPYTKKDGTMSKGYVLRSSDEGSMILNRLYRHLSKNFFARNLKLAGGPGWVLAYHKVDEGLKALKMIESGEVKPKTDDEIKSEIEEARGRMKKERGQPTKERGTSISDPSSFFKAIVGMVRSFPLGKLDPKDVINVELSQSGHKTGRITIEIFGPHSQKAKSTYSCEVNL